ncbi:MAG: hypothetical protein AAF430_01360 [Myxococcota bacterium]
MDPKELFERRSRKPVGPMEPASQPPGPMESVDEALFERLQLPIKELPRQLEFRRKTESWFSFPYHCLMGVEYFPHDRIVLTFTTHRVAVVGRNLERLYRGIRQQTADTVEEMDRATALATDEAELEIHGITITSSAEDVPSVSSDPLSEP